MSRWNETRDRLLWWTSGQGASEHLAAQVLQAEGFTDLDPSHPLGGKDAGKDALVRKDGLLWIMAAYFPRGQRSFATIRRKFLEDHRGVAANNAYGMAFVTNQELTLAQRKELEDAVDTPVELFHLDRVTTVLDKPEMDGVRAQFLGIGEASGPTADALARLEAIQTGGDTFCYVMLYHFDLQAGVAQQFCVIREGEFPLYDLGFRISDLDAETNLVPETPWGELNSPAACMGVRWSLRDSLYYRVFFHARNGAWNQDLQLYKSVRAECWLAATRVLGRNGRDVWLEHCDHGFVEEFGEPQWRT